MENGISHLTDNERLVVQSIHFHKTTVIWDEIAVQHFILKKAVETTKHTNDTK